ncbi:MAG: protein kinase [Gemmatimonadetes bacterium]|nr:protein kinase [Gemmatimonadota bacterium]
MSNGLPAQSVLADRYRIEEEIGEGGMSIVYRAHDLRHDRQVAVKVLRPEIAASLGEDRFQREIEIEAKLHHPNILQVYDSGATDDSLWFVMPLVEGETLADRLKREGQLSAEDATHIVTDVADALQYAHDRDIVHRDIKPSNILLTSGHALVADFGIARALSQAADETLTATGLTVGTPVYMSPEQAGGETVDRRADVYSLGCVLFEMLAGEPPFQGDSARAILTKQMVGTIPSIEVARAGLPVHFDATVRRALAKDPDDRFDTAADLASALSGHILPFGPAWKRRQQRRGLITAGTIVALAVAGWFALRAPPAIALDANRILVFPVSDTDLPTSDAGTGLDAAVLVITALEHAPPLKWDDGWRWMLPEQRSDPALLTPDSARDIARSLRARFFLDGEFHSRNDSATLFLRLNDVIGDSVYARAVATGPLDASAYSAITLAALTELLPSLIDPGRPPPDVSAVADRKPPAITAFLQGERAYRKARYPEAQSHYASAVERDSLFAFAALKGALAAEWTHDSAAVEGFLGAVSPRANELPARYASFYDGISAYDAGMADSAIAAFQTSLEQSPRWPEALTALGETHYHLIPTGVALAESVAEEYFRAAADADSGFVPPLLHLAEIAIRKGDLAAADTIVRRYMDADPTYGQGQLDLMLRCATGGPTSVDWEAEANGQPLETFRAARAMSVGMSLPDCARSALAPLTARPAATAGFEWGAFLMYQNVLMALGEYDAVRTLLEQAESTAALGVPYLYVIDAIAGAPFADSAAAQDGWLRTTFGENYQELRAPMALWVASIWNAEVGDTTRLEHIRGALEEVAREADDPLWRRRGVLFEAGAEADLARLRGDTALAIEAYGSLIPSVRSANWNWGLADPLAVERFRYAELLLAVGRYEDAIDVASVFDSPAAAVFGPFIPASLAIRLEAARVAGLTREERRFRERLERLGRSDLLGEPPAP